jgi:hypothetical protein
MNDETIGNSIFLVVSFFASVSFLILLWIIFPTTTMAYLFMAALVLLVGLLFFGLRRELQKGKRNVLQDVAQKTGLVPMDESYKKVAGQYCGREVTLELVLIQQKTLGEEVSLHYAHSTVSIENPANLFLRLSEREGYFDAVFEDEEAQFRARFSVTAQPQTLCEKLFDRADLQERLMAYHVEELTIRQNQLSFKVLSGDATYLLRLLDFLCDLIVQIRLIAPINDEYFPLRNGG